MSACICGERKANFEFFSEGYKIVQCITCGQVRTETPLNLKRTQFYNKDDSTIYIEKEEMFRSLFRSVIAFISRFKKKGRLLDIGAGVGLLANEAERAGFTVVGLEPSKSAVSAAKKHFGASLLQKEFSEKLFMKSFDVIVLNHVLEHLPNPKRVINDTGKVLKRGGLLVIGVPNFGSYLSIFKRNRWQSLIPDQHRWHFTLRSLDQLVLSFGFERIGENWENHDRTMHYWWKKPIYGILDQIALHTGLAEAMLVVYKKIL